MMDEQKEINSVVIEKTSCTPKNKHLAPLIAKLKLNTLWLPISHHILNALSYAV